jgi:hypothetical protein
MFYTLLVNQPEGGAGRGTPDHRSQVDYETKRLQKEVIGIGTLMPQVKGVLELGL